MKKERALPALLRCWRLCSALAISSSMGEDNSGFSEDENSSLDSAESVRINWKAALWKSEKGSIISDFVHLGEDCALRCCGVAGGRKIQFRK